ncbi:MAG: hypothetical protein ACRBCL_08380 [Maritimibacter sp.]
MSSGSQDPGARMRAKAARANARLSRDSLARFSARFDPQVQDVNPRPVPRDLFHFVHIPKTKGAAFGAALRAQAGLHGVPWNGVERHFLLRDQAARTAAQREGRPQVVMGHFGWQELVQLLKQGRAIFALAMVRDPVARLIANFDYSRSVSHPDFEDFRARYPSFEAYASDQPLNIQLKRLIGERPTFDLALNALATHYSFLGVSEAFEAGLAHFGAQHGLDGLSAPVLSPLEKLVFSGATQVSATYQNALYKAHFQDLRLHQLLSGFYANP